MRYSDLTRTIKDLIGKPNLEPELNRILNGNDKRIIENLTNTFSNGNHNSICNELIDNEYFSNNRYLSYITPPTRSQQEKQIKSDLQKVIAIIDDFLFGDTEIYISQHTAEVDKPINKFIEPIYYVLNNHKYSHLTLSEFQSWLQQNHTLLWNSSKPNLFLLLKKLDEFKCFNCQPWELHTHIVTKYSQEQFTEKAYNEQFSKCKYETNNGIYGKRAFKDALDKVTE
ncbi:MAG: hypothetical protein K1X91_02735 [Bacteriodetes bacterium]|nr:hypothetical protein [Bacteroidota bacterium]